MAAGQDSQNPQMPDVVNSCASKRCTIMYIVLKLDMNNVKSLLVFNMYKKTLINLIGAVSTVQYNCFVSSSAVYCRLVYPAESLSGQGLGPVVAGYEGFYCNIC
ncbi:hypothetical protein J6590_102576 [Homalodisca vitripennis]|nr:hypothetical protein J6590_102576 [Homalodisca vitripennis]